MEHASFEHGEEKLLAAFRKGTHLHYGPGEVFLHSSEQPDGIFLIRKGFVKVYTLTDAGEEHLHVIYRRGEIIPLLWALADIRRDSFYQSMSEVEIDRLDKRIFKELVDTDLDVARTVLQLTLLSFDVYADRIDNLELLSAYHRVVDRLILLARRFGEKRGKGAVLHAPITHQEIAESTNMARETTSREIERLEKKDLLRYENHEIVLTDLEKLSAELPL